MEADDSGWLGPATRDFISGAVAGAFAITVSQPLDTVRVRIQQSSAASGVPSTFSVLAGLVRREGLLSPWRGLTYPLLFASVQSAVLFQAYGWTLRQLASREGQERQEGWGASPSQQQELYPQSTSLGQQPHSHQQQHERHHVHHNQPHHHQPQQRQQPQQQSDRHSTLHNSRDSQGHSQGHGLEGHPQPHSHQVHLHHHHHRVQELTESDVHGPVSVTGRVVGYVASKLQALGLGSGSGSGQGNPHPALATPLSACSVLNQQQKQQQEQQKKKKHGTEERAPLPRPWHGFVAGGVAGAAQVVLWSPVELLKLRAQLQTAIPGSAGYRNPAALAAQVLRQDGVAGLYRGFTLTVVRDVPSYAMYFWLYHDIASALSPGMHPEQAPPTTQVLAGGLAGVLAWLPIYPLDVIKTRVQAVTTATATIKKTWWQHGKELRAERALYRGVAPTLMRAFLMDGAAFLGYSTTLKMLGGSSGTSASTNNAASSATNMGAGSAESSSSSNVETGAQFSAAAAAEVAAGAVGVGAAPVPAPA